MPRRPTEGQSARGGLLRPHDATVFLVADEADRRRTLLAAVEAMGFGVEPFPTLSKYRAELTRDRTGCLLYDAATCAAGLDAAAPLADDWPAPPVIYLTEDHDVSIVVRAMRGATADFLFRHTFAESDLWEAIQKATAMHVRLRVAAADRARRRRILESLTDSERDVLRLLIAGRNNRQISEQLALTRSTVESRRLRLMKKLGVRHLPALVRFVVAAEA
jgi:two-component system CheB/CheR fusion protein